MNISNSWSYLKATAKKRLANNKTARHVENKDNFSHIELLGVAGELTARRFLGLPEVLHTHHDGGYDLKWAGYTVDVKATKMAAGLEYRYLQWPDWKPVRADIILLTAVNLSTKTACVVGWTWGRCITEAPVNSTREYPCHEVPVTELYPPWKLMVEAFKHEPK